jgi:N-acetylmuramoyl-L-alanine amidase
VARERPSAQTENREEKSDTDPDFWCVGRAGRGSQHAPSPPAILTPMRRWSVLPLLLLLLAGCAGVPDRSPLAEWRGSPNHNPRAPRLIVIHHTQTPSVDEAMRILRRHDGEGRVSAHYLVAADGRTWQLVRESERAWHAGRSRWAGFDDVNSVSIGIELDNDGASPFPDAQVEALLRLLEDIVYRNRIDRSQVVGHGDVALGRKTDPSARFPWATLAAHGFGIWPRADRGSALPGFDALVALRLIGYDTSEPVLALKAFQRRFRGIENGGALDDEDRAILYDLQLQLTQPVPRVVIRAPMD